MRDPDGHVMLARASAGLLGLLLVLALVIFASAGTLHYWRGWLYLGVFGACAVLITAYLALYDRGLLARRIEGGALAEPAPQQKLISGLANVVFLGLFVLSGLDVRFGWSAVSGGVSLIAEAFVALGFIIVFLTFRANSFTSAIVTVAEAQPLVDRGPYAVVRHPMYAGAMVMLIATPLALGSWWALILIPAMVLVIVARLVDEERQLSARLHGYDAYRLRVRHRLLPGLW